MSEKEIKEKIEAVKEEMKEVHGSKCEVYSRCCGYLRPVQGYNKGKQEEFAMRKMYNAGNGEEAKCCANKLHEANAEIKDKEIKKSNEAKA